MYNFPNKKIYIITGHFGSGKTELSINFALELRKIYQLVAISDLDVINPYFRSRYSIKEFEENDIDVIAPKGKLATADLPIVSGEIYRAIHHPDYKLVIDVGGDKDGATALGQFAPQISQYSYEMYFVVNVMRPYASTVEGIVDIVRKIENVSRLKITSLVNTSNLGRETMPENVMDGLEITLEASKALGIPIAFSAVWEKILPDLREKLKLTEVLPIKRHTKLPWE